MKWFNLEKKYTSKHCIFKSLFHFDNLGKSTETV